MNRKYTLPAVAIVASLALVTSCHKSKKPEAEEAETVDVALPVVKSVTLYNEYPGYLTSNAAVDIVAKVSGNLLSKNYKSGSTVQKGAVLFTIDNGTYRDRVAQAEGDLATAISNRDYAKEHYEAVKKALESDAVSKMEVQQSLSNYEQAEASIKEARATLATARRNLGYCTVTAPITGAVTTDEIDVGNYVNGEVSPVKLATMYDNSVMKANFSIEDQRYLELINSRNDRDSLDMAHIPLTFSDSIPHKYTGRLNYLAPAITQSTGTMPVECLIDNTYDELRPGMYVKVNLPYGKSDNAVLVNDASISTDQLGKYLYVVNDSNKVVYTPVQVGALYDDTLRVVTSGLGPNDRYVTRALLKVREGMTVKPRLVNHK